MDAGTEVRRKEDTAEREERTSIGGADAKIPDEMKDSAANG